MSGSSSSTQTLRPLIKRLDAESSKIISNSADIAYQLHHEQLTVFHIALVLLKSDNKLIKSSLGLSEACHFSLLNILTSIVDGFPAIQGITPIFSEKVISMLKDAFLNASLHSAKNPVITVHHLIENIYKDNDFINIISKKQPEIIREILNGKNNVNSNTLNSTENSSPNSRVDEVDLPYLTRFTDDLTHKANNNKIDPVVGRYSEVEKVVQILIRRRQNNPILVGEAGVGKTAIVEALALKVSNGNVPDQLRDVSIRVLDIGALKAGAAQKGELESRLKSIMLEITTSNKPIILFVDEIHAFMGSSSSNDNMEVANLIKPELGRGKFKIIGATTWVEYKKFIEKDPALVRRFQLIKVDEPSKEDTLDILTAIAPTLENHHTVKISYNAIRSAIDYSVRYLPSRQLPDKAISLLDTACARRSSEKSAYFTKIKHIEEQIELIKKRCLIIEQDQSDSRINYQVDLEAFKVDLTNLEEQQKILTDNQITGNLVVDKLDVASVISNWTGVPSEQVGSGQSERLRLLESKLKQRIVGQEDALQTIINRLKTYSAGIAAVDRPIGVFMITGPTGVGKTEAAHAISDLFFGPESITVINMSEYQESHTVSKLKGAPAGYVGYGQGGILTEAIRRKPYGLLLLDEFEKAHPDVHNLFLQIFDKGFIEDSEGLKIDFTSTLILLTSNAGFDYDPRLSLVKSGSSQDAIRGLDSYFSQALLGRIELLEFHGLELNELTDLVQRKLTKLSDRFYGIHKKKLLIEDSVCNYIAGLAYNNPEGGRVIERLINTNIERIVSEVILNNMNNNKPIKDISVFFDGTSVILKELD